jgi:hypothetical protein
MVAEADRSQALALPLNSHEERHEEADATTVHVVEAGEVEHDRLGAGGACRRVRIHQGTFAGGCHVAPDDDGAGGRGERPHIDGSAARGHAQARA